MKRFLCLILIVLMLFQINVFASNKINFDSSKINAIASKMVLKNANPNISSTGGEWLILGLLRSDIGTFDAYFDTYIKNARKYVNDTKAVLSSRKYTEYSRVVLCLNALGIDARNFEGYDLVAPLLDFEKTTLQGINGAIFALIALDSFDYGLDIDDIKSKYVNYILSKQLENGAFPLGISSDVDITSMAICAISNYKNQENVQNAIFDALTFLSSMQNEDGGYSTSENISQVIVALSSASISIFDDRFVKNGNTLTDALEKFYNNDEFKHMLDLNFNNQMATEQAFLAIVALDRFNNNKSNLYDFKDIKKDVIIKNEDEKTFLDIENSKYKNSIISLATKEIINGKSDDIFEPNSFMTRAEFATIIVKALNLTSSKKSNFKDVLKDDWYYPYILAAFENGIVNGISSTIFNPNGVITKQEAAAMVYRAAIFLNLTTDFNKNEINNILAAFDDYKTISDWALTPFAFCYENDILSNEDININPLDIVNREEIANMVYMLLNLK